MMSRRSSVLFAAALATLTAPGVSRAALANPLYWDTNGTAAGAATAGVASGTWDTSTPNWITDSTGAAPTTAYPADGSSTDAVFSAGTDATGVSPVTLAGSISANSLNFEEGTVNLKGVAPANPGDPLTSVLTLGAGGISIVKATSTAATAAPTTDANLKLVLAADQTWTMDGVGTSTTLNGPVQFDHNLTLNRTTTGGQPAQNANFRFANAASTGNGTLTVGPTSSTTLQIAANAVYDPTSGAFLTGPVGTGTIRFNAGRISSVSAATSWTVGNPVEFANGAAIGGSSNNGALTFTGAVTVDANATTKTVTFENTADTFNGPTTLLASINFNPTSINTTTFAGPISDDFAATGIAKNLTKGATSGTLILAGANTYAGSTTIFSGGTLTLNGSLANGKIAINNGTFNGTGTINFNISPTAADKITDKANFAIAGLTLAIHVTGLPTPGDYTLVDYSTATTSLASSSFAAVTGLNGGSDLTNTGTAIVAHLRYPGDANKDDALTPDDYALIDQGFAQHLTGWTHGDFNSDGVIDQQDYLLIDSTLLALGGHLSPDQIDARTTAFGPDYIPTLLASVPEPTSLLTACGFALLPLLNRTRRPR